MIETKKQNYIDGRTKSPKVRGYVCCLYKAESFQLHLSIVKKIMWFFFQNYVTVSIGFHFLIKPNIKQFDVQSMVYLNLVLK